MTQLTIPVSDLLRIYVELAVTRLGYIHPKLRFSIQSNTVIVEGNTDIDEVQVRRDVLYTLYREKIYAETLSMRKTLVDLVSAP